MQINTINTAYAILQFGSGCTLAYSPGTLKSVGPSDTLISQHGLFNHSFRICLHRAPVRELL